MGILNEQQETAYLADLLLQASRWERSEGEVLSGVELEIQDRMRRLTGINTVDEEGRAQSEIANGPWNDPDHPNRVRVSMPDGKKKWVPKDMVDKVPSKHSKTGFKYVLKEGADDVQP